MYKIKGAVPPEQFSHVVPPWTWGEQALARAGDEEEFRCTLRKKFPETGIDDSPLSNLDFLNPNKLAEKEIWWHDVTGGFCWDHRPFKGEREE